MTKIGQALQVRVITTFLADGHAGVGRPLGCIPDVLQPSVARRSIQVFLSTCALFCLAMPGKIRPSFALAAMSALRVTFSSPSTQLRLQDLLLSMSSQKGPAQGSQEGVFKDSLGRSLEAGGL